uniref:Uncharacterized protein n=1 Tax=Oryza sativa subsp. japonica TaxID=39947 RepID=Q6K368_ORYSJ|nr:hypothetical protein [Oryza sativa Japonica Group]BAD22450.1 hypothetical protein [Oryza sativa Japonica Group]
MAAYRPLTLCLPVCHLRHQPSCRRILPSSSHDYFAVAHSRWAVPLHPPFDICKIH